jgi:cellulose synthase (UDP-forming)
MSQDPRLRPPTWDASAGVQGVRWRVNALIVANVLAAVWYFGWLLQPGRVGVPLLFGLLVAAELYNLVQASGFWWTNRHQRVRGWVPAPSHASVNVLIPVYGEPAAVVEPTIAAACRLRGADVRVHVLDDGEDPAIRAAAERHGARWVTRERSAGAKAGAINDALGGLDGDFIVVFDSDFVADPAFLEATLGHFRDERVAFVQTPQYYANAPRGGVAEASWAQQALFFGAIARGKDGMDAMFCAGTNVVFRRAALVEHGGFPEDSLTEDFELSIALHERGWRSVYVSQVLARGLGPEDMAAYVGQQQRWARGCLSAIPRALRARLPWRHKLQYLLSSMFFLSGWTYLVYVLLPVIALLTGALPIDAATADEFLVHFAPYWGLALLHVAIAGKGSYTFQAFALWAANFWVHIVATLLTVSGRKGSFKVTPKEGAEGRQPGAVWPGLTVVLLLAGAATYGLTTAFGPATVNNAAFALLHLGVVASGIMPALRRAAPEALDEPVDDTERSVA